MAYQLDNCTEQYCLSIDFGINEYVITSKSILIQTVDLSSRVIKIIEHFYRDSGVVVFVIDICEKDQELITETKFYIHSFLNNA